MYLTTPDEPLLVVNKICHKHSSETILLGKYQVQDKTVSNATKESGNGWSLCEIAHLLDIVLFYGRGRNL